MIERIVELSVRHRALVLLLTAGLLVLGAWGYRNIRLDAIPDLSDVQVIVVTDFPGQNPQVVDDQVTYPLCSALLAVPGATDVRGISMFELSFVYVLFEDGTDIYWARSRVLEYLSTVRGRLPAGVAPELGPDATGVGWVYQYALRSDRHDLSELRALQDYYLRYPLSSVEGVSEVASFGGFVKEYQVVLDPDRIRAFGLRLRDVADAIRRSNDDVGGSVVERAEQEYMVRSRGYLRGLAELAEVPVGLGDDGTPVLLAQVADLTIGGEARRSVGELDGMGEAVGGIVVARFGSNAREVIEAVKQRIEALKAGLPDGVEIVPTYDRSLVIDRSVGTLRTAVIEELLVTAGICIVFLAHVRSALVALLVLPIGLLTSILLMTLLGINANIMSIGGLALAIGVMVDSGVVLIENAHKHLQRARDAFEREGTPMPAQPQIVLAAAKEVAPSLFSSLLVITVSFLPIFTLGGESGRMFGPLAWTKTFAIAAGAILGITVVPALMVYLVRGRIPREERNPVNRLSEAIYEPFFWVCLRHPYATLLTVLLLGASTLYPLSRLGSEFMPKLDEGDLLYMPTTDPSVSIGKAREVLQQTDRLIATVPEVRTVHGKIGRADTATDPAPLSMIETVVQLETDRTKWRTRTVARFHERWPKWLRDPLAPALEFLWPTERPITMEELKYGWTEPDGTHHAGIDSIVKLPGMANAWPYPIENRINMLATGIKTPVGIKLFGPDLDVLNDLAARTAAAVQVVSGTTSAYAENNVGGLYLDVDVDRAAAARHGLTIGDVQDVVRTAIGGMAVATAVEGLGRYPINMRYARELRDDLPALREVLVDAPTGALVPLGELAELHVTPGPPMLRSENAQRTAWVYVDIAGRDLGSYVADARAAVDAAVPLPAGYSRHWSGTFEQLEETNRRLGIVVPITGILIVLLLYMGTGSWFRVGVILLAVPFSLIGAFWFLWALDYDMSLAVWVGIIALLGVDAETGQVMLLYLDSEYESARRAGRLRTLADLHTAIHAGAVKRIRPKTMTVATDMIGLLPLLWASGTGADVTRRLVAPLIGGITVSFLMELLVYPVIFVLWKRWQLRGQLAEVVA
ncbi:MAG: efflux RND transporter permease subunit [Planctomycetes bacterium]|nr:efflux RND transporter permease subunit [Planctomycetota bacterium]